MDYRLEQLRFELREDPTSRIFFKLGEHLRREGELDEAIDVLQNGLGHHPRYVAAWVSLGRALHDFGDAAAAVEAFLKALELDPENAVAARSAGEAAIANGDWLEAVKNLKRARGILPQDEELDQRIAFVEEQLDELGMLEVKPAAPPVEEPPADEIFVVEDDSEEESASGVDDVFDTGSDPQDADAGEIDSDRPEMIEEPLSNETEIGEDDHQESDEVDFEIVDDGAEEESPLETGSIEVEEPVHASRDTAEVEILEPVADIEAPVVPDPPPPPEISEEPAVEMEPETVFDLDEQDTDDEAGDSPGDTGEDPDQSSGDVPMPTVTLARLAAEQGNFDLAERTARAVLEREPDQPDAIALLKSIAARNESDDGAPDPANGADRRARALQRWLEAVRLAAEKLES